MGGWSGASVFVCCVDPSHGRGYLLLGRESYGQWSDFGGRASPGEDDGPEATASRELEEETLGVLRVSPESLRAGRYLYRFETRYAPGDPPFVTFLLQWPFEPDLLRRFAAARSACGASTEKDRLALVSVPRLWTAVRDYPRAVPGGPQLLLREPFVPVARQVLATLMAESPGAFGVPRSVW